MELYPNGEELVWRRIFPGRPDQASRAREFVAYLLTDLPNVDDAVLVTSEFVSNALRHTASARPDGKFLLEVRRNAGGATIALVDQGSHKEPVTPNLDDMSEFGRGLYMVRALASDLTWTGDRKGRILRASFEGKHGCTHDQRIINLD